MRHRECKNKYGYKTCRYWNPRKTERGKLLILYYEKKKKISLEEKVSHLQQERTDAISKLTH